MEGRRRVGAERRGWQRRHTEAVLSPAAALHGGDGRGGTRRWCFHRRRGFAARCCHRAAALARRGWQRRHTEAVLSPAAAGIRGASVGAPVVALRPARHTSMAMWASKIGAGDGAKRPRGPKITAAARIRARSWVFRR
uniref:Uncharacterized protein n=1 Tax=Oryza punctata TaxID=4537 RepID=A0A0E0MQ63_ORYPU